MFRDNKYVLLMLVVGLFSLAAIVGWARTDSDIEVTFIEASDRYVHTSLPSDYEHPIDIEFMYEDKDSCVIKIMASINPVWNVEESDSLLDAACEMLEHYLDVKSNKSCVMNLFTHSDTSYVFGNLLSSTIMYGGHHDDDADYNVDWRAEVHVQLLRSYNPGLFYIFDIDSLDVKEMKRKVAVRDSLIKASVRQLVIDSLLDKASKEVLIELLKNRTYITVTKVIIN